MKNMNKKKYLVTREALMNEAEELINAGKTEEADKKMEEVKDLDNKWDEIAKAQANYNALNNELKGIKIDNLAGETGLNGTVVDSTHTVDNNEPSYEDVFSKVALKRDLTNDEIAVFNKFNPENVYTHTTTNTEIAIPETVVGGIESTMKELHPILADVRSTRIKGTVKYVKHTGINQGDADYYDEETPTADEENVFGELVLGGKELSKAVTVSWKLQAMAVEDFVPFLQRELGERMSYAKANAFVRGAGDAKYPQGIITALEAQTDTPQVVEFADALTYEDLTSARGKIKSMHSAGAKIYANNTTIWNTLATLKDAQGRPLFIPDVTAGGVGRIFGIPVMEEDAMNENEILLANMASGYKENIQETMVLTTEQHAKARKTDFVGYEVHDAGVNDETAFALIRPLIQA